MDDRKYLEKNEMNFRERMKKGRNPRGGNQKRTAVAVGRTEKKNESDWTGPSTNEQWRNLCGSVFDRLRRSLTFGRADPSIRRRRRRRWRRRRRRRRRRRGGGGAGQGACRGAGGNAAEARGNAADTRDRTSLPFFCCCFHGDADDDDDDDFGDDDDDDGGGDDDDDGHGGPTEVVP